jgi:hypothetical protein
MFTWVFLIMFELHSLEQNLVELLQISCNLVVEYVLLKKNLKSDSYVKI